MMLGAVVLMVFMGAAALLAGRMLYGEKVSGRIPVGVVLPEGDYAAKQVMSMISSLESVKSLCDFTYGDRETCVESLENGEVFAVLDVPERFVEGIMDGTNEPVRVLLSEESGVSGRIFKELTDAGALTLGSAQAGIYAGGELLSVYGLSGSMAELERDLNSIYLKYSLPRMEYFKKVKVSAAGDVDVVTFYGISLFVLALVFSSVPVSGFLLPDGGSMEWLLAVHGVGRGTVLGAKILGLSVLFLWVAVPVGAVAVYFGWMEAEPVSAAATMFFCMAAASVTVFFYRAAGSRMGGVMLLFSSMTVIHFLSGGFLPPVFLPEAVRKAGEFLPSGILMDGLKMIVTGAWNPVVFGKLCILAAAGFLAGLAVEVGRK